jgi:hypothetical protein
VDVDDELPSPRLELRIDGAMLAWYDPPDMPRAMAHAAQVARRPTGALIELVQVERSGANGVVFRRVAGEDPQDPVSAGAPPG